MRKETATNIQSFHSPDFHLIRYYVFASLFISVSPSLLLSLSPTISLSLPFFTSLFSLSFVMFSLALFLYISRYPTLCSLSLVLYLWFSLSSSIDLSLSLYFSLSLALLTGAASPASKTRWSASPGASWREAWTTFCGEEPSRRRTMILTCRRLASLSTGLPVKTLTE